MDIGRNNSLMRQPNIHLSRKDIARYVFLPGDPGRSAKIAAYFDDPHFLCKNKEYVSYSGTLLGEKVAVVSTGIGGPSTAIAVEELIGIGADIFIRVGTSGGMQPFCKTGDVAIVNGAIRDEGTTSNYLPIEFPALADIDVVLALKEGAQQLGIPFHIGISHSKDSYFGEVEPDRMPVNRYLLSRWKAWSDGGAICSEMEASTIFIICSIYKKKAGGVMLMMGNETSIATSEEENKKKEMLFDVNRAIQVAIQGVKVLIEHEHHP
jgi:uridine phosphorylase